MFFVIGGSTSKILNAQAEFFKPLILNKKSVLDHLAALYKRKRELILRPDLLIKRMIRN